MNSLLKLSNADLMAEINDEEIEGLKRELDAATREAVKASERMERAEQQLAEVRQKIAKWCDEVREDLRAEADLSIGGDR